MYLAKLSGTRTSFAMEIMNKTKLANRKKLLRSQTEREILQSLDHPFLPTLYTHLEAKTFSCLVMEFFPGGDLHPLRQRQPEKNSITKQENVFASRCVYNVGKKG